MKILSASTRILFQFQIGQAEAHQSGHTSIGKFVEDIIAPHPDEWLQFDPKHPRDKPGHSGYFVEYHFPVQRFLFDAVGGTGCYYFRLNLKTEPRLRVRYQTAISHLDSPYWLRDDASSPNAPTLRGLEILGVGNQTGGDGKSDPLWKCAAPDDSSFLKSISIQFDETAGVELWISRMGVGVLALTLNIDPLEGETIDPRKLLELNHDLATAQKAVWLKAPSTELNPTIPFHIHSFARELMKPFWGNQHVVVEFNQRAKVHAALRIDCRSIPAETHGDVELDQFLSQLAQVHPASHPGDPMSEYAPRIDFNARHFCRVSSCGAAHATLIDPAVLQLPDFKGHYDYQRLKRTQFEYFSAYLLAQLQQLCMQRMLDDSVEAANETKHGRQRDRYKSLVETAQRFGLEADFVDVSWRPQCQKFYSTTRDVCHVTAMRASIRTAMSDYDRVARDEEAESTEATMRIVEAFIVTIYSVELSHILSACFPIAHNEFLGWSFIAVAVVTYLIVAWYIMRRQTGHVRTWRNILALFVITSLIQAAFLGANRKWNLKVPDSNSPSLTESPSGH